MRPPIGIALVAAGDGALQTWSMRADSRKRKSCTSVPSRVTAWARIPAVYGNRSLTVRIGQYLRHSWRYADLSSDPVSSARTDARVAGEHPPEAGKEQVLRDVAHVHGELPISLSRQTEHRVRADRHAAVDHAREMDAEEGEVRVRDGVDQTRDDVVLRAREPVVLAAEGNDLMRDRQAGEARQSIGLEARAGDEAAPPSSFACRPGR
jgi:hypothetical protein